MLLPKIMTSPIKSLTPPKSTTSLLITHFTLYHSEFIYVHQFTCYHQFCEPVDTLTIWCNISICTGAFYIPIIFKLEYNCFTMLCQFYLYAFEDCNKRSLAKKETMIIIKFPKMISNSLCRHADDTCPSLLREYAPLLSFVCRRKEATESVPDTVWATTQNQAAVCHRRQTQARTASVMQDEVCCTWL